LPHRLEQGIIERLGRGRGVRLLLSQRFCRRSGKAGAYTRKRGLDRETNKALLVCHLQESGDAGCPIAEMQQVLPAQSLDQLKRLLSELRREGRTRLIGERRGARWRVEEDG
jgi:ATP-dependent DNA helicase RecG